MHLFFKHEKVPDLDFLKSALKLDSAKPVEPIAPDYYARLANQEPEIGFEDSSCQPLNLVGRLKIEFPENLRRSKWKSLYREYSEGFENGRFEPHGCTIPTQKRVDAVFQDAFIWNLGLFWKLLDVEKFNFGKLFIKLTAQI